VSALPEFGVLLPVYGGSSAAQLRRALRSTADEQSLRPAELVVVRDGPVPDELRRELEELVATSEVPVRVVALEENVGLAAALNRGLAESAYPVVARMDADDVSAPERFAVQLRAMADGALDLVGAGLYEFTGDAERVMGLRIPPVGATEIRRAASFRQPFNHPTVVYRREAVLAAGGYPTDVGRFEDYVLFARMLVSGARVDNVAEPLVYYRVDDGAYARRGGLGHFRDEVRLQRELRALGLTTRLQRFRNVALRAPYRLVSAGVRERVYRRFAVVPDRRGV